MLKNLSPELENLARMPPISFKNRELVLENLIAPVQIDRMDAAHGYLASRGWKGAAVHEDEFIYSRGSVLGNVTSFHAEKLKSTAVLNYCNSAILLSVTVDTNFQIITMYNYLSLQVEMEDFGESVLTGAVSHQWRDQFANECGSRLYVDWSPAKQYWKTD